MNTQNLTLGEAIEAMKSGDKVARVGWNGKGMFLFLIAETAWGFATDVKGLDKITTCAFICMKTADNKLIPWLASQADALANDYVILN